MPHIHRFFVPNMDPSAGEVCLPEEEAHHALRVARLRPGDTVKLFDGRGGACDARLARATRHEAWVQVEDRRHVPEPVPRIHLLQAWLHRDKCIEEIIVRGTELGVSRFCFFRADHSEKAPKRQDKWERLAIEACKQCGRLWTPSFEIADDLSAALEGIDANVLIAAMYLSEIPLQERLEGEKDVCLIVGPEGDFSAKEMSMAVAHGAHSVSLGTTTFRAEVAATVLATIVAYELGRLGPRHAV